MICSFCNGKVLNKTIKIYSDFFKNDINYYRCNFCKSLHQFPIPNEKKLKKYYESYNDIKSKMNPGYLTDINYNNFKVERKKTLNEIGFDISNIFNNNNVELGCANGQFLLFLHELGAQNIIGIDISENLINSIKISNVKTIVGDLSYLKNNSIDNLYLFNILEHIPNIENLMKLIKIKLKKSGNIIIEVPLAGIISSYFDKKWRFLMPYEHLHIPSIKGLKSILYKFDLKIINSTRFGSGYTSGMINQVFKILFDKTAKFFQYGDRGTFLIQSK